MPCIRTPKGESRRPWALRLQWWTGAPAPVREYRNSRRQCRHCRPYIGLLMLVVWWSVHCFCIVVGGLERQEASENVAFNAALSSIGPLVSVASAEPLSQRCQNMLNHVGSCWMTDGIWWLRINTWSTGQCLFTSMSPSSKKSSSYAGFIMKWTNFSQVSLSSRVSSLSRIPADGFTYSALVKIYPWQDAVHAVSHSKVQSVRVAFGSSVNCNA